MIFDAVFAIATSCWPDHSGQWRGGAAVSGDCGGSDQSVLIIIINGCHTIYTHTHLFLCSPHLFLVKVPAFLFQQSKSNANLVWVIELQSSRVKSCFDSVTTVLPHHWHRLQLQQHRRRQRRHHNNKRCCWQRLFLSVSR